MSVLKNSVIGLLTVAALTGCGGSDDGGDSGSAAPTTPTSGERAVITTENAPQIVASTMSGMGAALDASNGLGTTTRAFSAPKQVNLKTVTLDILDFVEQSKDFDKGVSARATNVVTQDCPDGGSMSMNVDEYGNGSFSYNQCSYAGTTMNGSMETTVDPNTGNIRYVMTNYTVASAHMTSQFSSLRATIDMQNDRMEETFSGSITVDDTYSIAAGTYEYANMSVVIEGFYTSATSRATISGDVKTPCTGGWVSMQTLEALQTPAGQTCSESGKVQITGANGSSLLYEAVGGGAVEITVGSSVERYNSCTDIENSCGAAQ